MPNFLYYVIGIVIFLIFLWPIWTKYNDFEFWQKVSLTIVDIGWIIYLCFFIHSIV